ncbi:hypothetical protein OH76DRAFT_1487958 [Lentinus brumalis]|uniref:Uncharacterized protein n=1 Tax=Lentinus brumalis TaxID=2498619 RepID=A0A371CSX6_9APHY|nr:hypothetical protein OH76DRAFT_1487958 [Polyporus brumalis]
MARRLRKTVARQRRHRFTPSNPTPHLSQTSTHAIAGSPWSSIITEDFPDGPLIPIDGIVLAAGLRREEYDAELEGNLQGARKWPCSSCHEDGEPCVQSNGGAWRCKRCLVLGLNGCEWEIQTYAILGLQKDASLRKPKIDYERLEELESAGLQVDHLEVVIFAVGFQAEEYSERDKKAIAHLRAAPCTPCLRIGQHCTQTNGESWKCKNCLLFARSGCEWQIDTALLLGENQRTSKPKVDRRQVKEQVAAKVAVDSRSIVIRSRRRIMMFVNAHHHLVPADSPLHRLLHPSLRQSGLRPDASPGIFPASGPSRTTYGGTATLSESAAPSSSDPTIGELARITATQARQEALLREIAQRLNIPVLAAEDAEDQK